MRNGFKVKNGVVLNAIIVNHHDVNVINVNCVGSEIIAAIVNVKSRLDAYMTGAHIRRLARPRGRPDTSTSDDA